MFFPFLLNKFDLSFQVYRPHSFWVNMVDSLYQSLVIFFVAAAAYAESDVGIWEFGTVICTSSLAVMLTHLAVETKSWVSRLC
jgi:phospholipid-translocating ATPase